MLAGLRSPDKMIPTLSIFHKSLGRDHVTKKRIEELKKQISELKSQWPKHSVPPGMIQQLDELEEELERELKKDTQQQSRR
jgi:hypothetical protein